ncbi:MAG: copper chaperone PCu(A)C [Methyloligellaceae bacterium]
MRAPGFPGEGECTPEKHRLMMQRKLEIAAAIILTVTALILLTVRLTGASEPGSAVLQVEEAWARPTLGSARNGAVYMVIRNKGAGAVRLTGVRTPASARAEIHRTIQDNGVMRMRPVKEGIEIPANGEVVFKPGGYHVMLLDLTRPLKEGESFPLTLEFAAQRTIEVQVQVTRTPGEHAMPRGSADGHHQH